MDGFARMTGIGFIKRLLGNTDGEQGSVPHVQATLGARMLVVDDSPTICAVLGKMLGHEGYAVSRANDGDNAIQLARDEQPALIFLDIVLPGMNGFAVLRALRHDPLTRHIPIMMISGNQQATEQFYVQRFGADDFMKKPFGRDEVCKRIGQLVQSGRLAARKPSEPVSLPLSELSEEALAAIPDIAMPYADEPHAIVPSPRPRPGLQMAHGVY
ncbi:response regulator [Rhodanobacter glycinis]|uniref:Response regulator n=1 Tax=Rhodanobacter glycinis TaxID=582702 RepID=A0A502BWQ0_9GAMM|nr:response regulator [Rhodanobacter glycinis]TPG05357.1 response regulator [Rhodanobacter glycinis]